MIHAIAHSPWWLSAGCTMVHVLGIGASVGLFGWAGRLVLTHHGVDARYRFTLACLCALALVPAALLPCLEVQIDSPRAIVTPSSGAAAGDAGDEAGRDDEALLGEAMASGAVVRSGLVAGAGNLAKSSHWAPILAWLSRWGPWVWMGGSGAMLLLTVGGVLSIRRMCGAARPEGGAIQDRSNHLCASMGMPSVPVALLERLGSPVLVGWRRPVILLPAYAASRWTAEQTEMVLLHELAHARRRDNLVTLLQRLMEVLFFFNPAVWYLSRRVQEDRETICDRFVLERTHRHMAYAELLLGFCRLPVSTRLGAAMGEHKLVTRIRFVLSPDASSSASRRARVLAGLVVALGVLSLGAYRTIASIPLPVAGVRVVPPQPPSVQADNPAGAVGIPEAASVKPETRAMPPGGVTFLVVDGQGWAVPGALCDANVRLRDGKPMWEEASNPVSDQSGALLSPVVLNKPLTEFYFQQVERGLVGAVAVEPNAAAGAPVPVLLSPACRIALDLSMVDASVSVDWTKAFIRLRVGDCAGYLLRQTRTAAPWHYEFDLPPGSYELIAFGGSNADSRPRTEVHVHCFDVPPNRSNLELDAIRIGPKPATAARTPSKDAGMGAVIVGK